jgi:hypothetical protein
MKPHYERPLAAPGLTSYRYRGGYGWIMIGATCIAEALREADRSLSVKGATADRLEIWDSESACYVPAVS